MSAQPLRVAITGAAGNIAYQLAFMLFEKAFPGLNIELRLLDLPEQMAKLQGVAMELEDCALPGLSGICITDKSEVAFEQANWIIMLGAFPRLQGMERSDLLVRNAGIFNTLGRSIGQHASEKVQVIVVGNPCNTNAMIAANAAKNIAPSAFTSLSFLDQNRAVQALATHLGCPVQELSGVTVWGNHSAKLVTDLTSATCRGLPVSVDSAWVYDHWMPWVQNRGANVIKQRGASSAASAAHAVCEHIRHLRMLDSPIFSLGVQSKGEYGSVPGTWVSMPHQMRSGHRVLIDNYVHDERMLSLLKASFEELAIERKLCQELSLLC